MDTLRKVSNINLVMTGDEWIAIRCECGEDFLIVGLDVTECDCGRKYFCKIKTTIYQVEEA